MRKRACNLLLASLLNILNWIQDVSWTFSLNQTIIEIPSRISVLNAHQIKYFLAWYSSSMITCIPLGRSYLQFEIRFTLNWKVVIVFVIDWWAVLLLHIEDDIQYVLCLSILSQSVGYFSLSLSAFSVGIESLLQNDDVSLFWKPRVTNSFLSRKLLFKVCCKFYLFVGPNAIGFKMKG